MVRTGWVYRVGNREVYPPSHPATLLEEDPRSRQRSGPRKPCRGWSGWPAGSGRTRCSAAGTAISPPSGPGRSSPASPPWDMPLECRLWANMARFQSFYWKLSQNDEVSTKKCEKASHSPYFQNGCQKSPLGFLGFPYLRAFSHKELMGHFDPATGFIVKMMKFRPYVHPYVTRSGRSDTPTRARSKLPLCTCSSSDLGAASS